MPLDSAALAQFEKPSQYQEYAATVEQNPRDFSTWTKLLQAVEDLVSFFLSIMKQSNWFFLY